jgi:hypothetical protein
MKLFFFTSIAVLSFLASTPGADKPAVVNQYVKYAGKLSAASLKPGASGNLLVSLKPAKGIHINLKPALSVRFDSLSEVRPNGDPEIPKKGEYLDAAGNIRIPIIVPASFKSGTASLKAELTYYYCSDAEGWCSRFKQPIELSLTVGK